MPPARILLLRPDTYGDLFLFEPVPRILCHAWPEAEVAVLIREPYQDIVPLIDTEGVRWLTTTCNPYREAPNDHPASLHALRETLQAFSPDCVVAACTEQTWLEAAVAAFLPGVRQVSVGDNLSDPAVRAALEAVTPVDWQAIYRERIVIEPGLSEWEKNLALASGLLETEAPRWWPTAHVPGAARARAREIVAEAGLSHGAFVACAAAGIANVRIKCWPAEHYGEILAWLERDRGIRALLIGHTSERGHLEAVQTAARAYGGDPALWTGSDGEVPVVAALLDAARFYFGNDTGAVHLAAALGRPVASIFGGGHWPRFRPVAARECTFVQPLPCFGCAWECDYADAPCVQTISTLSVRQGFDSFLSTDAPAQIVFEAEGLEVGARAVIDAATPRLRFLRGDAKARLRQVEELTTLLTTSETDRADRLYQVEELTTLLATSEADRAGRQQQIEELSKLLATSEADRANRLESVEELTALLATSEADRAVRLKHVDELTALLHVSEADRAARLISIESLTALLADHQADSTVPALTFGRQDAGSSTDSSEIAAPNGQART